MPHTPDPRPFLVIGSTGKTGRRVAARLDALGHRVRHGSRSAPIPFDWADRQTWAPALTGAQAVYIAFHPDLAAPGSEDAISELVELARTADVRHVVLLSGRGEEEAQRAEAVVRRSGVAWTIVRAAWFAQNFTEGSFADDVAAGFVALPVGEVLEPFVDADDIADVAVAAMTDDRHRGQVYEVTGPRLLTFADAVATLGAKTGRDVRFGSVSTDDYVATLAEYRVPTETIELLRYLFTSVLDGRNAWIADGVHRALGRPPKDFTDFAGEIAHALGKR